MSEPAWLDAEVWSLTPDGYVVRHGNPVDYNAGCRCEHCRKANRLRHAAGNAARIARGKDDPSVIPHGIGGYGNWGCRCDVCTLANILHCAKWRQERSAARGG